MKQIQKKSASPVFEMILESSSKNHDKVGAAPSKVVLPENWHEEHQEGQLAVDVAQNEKDVIVLSTMAGSDTEKIEVYVHNDLLTIRGMRKPPIDFTDGIDYFYQECFWGNFSRTIVLPVDVKGELAKAEYKNGILVIHIPKRDVDTKVPITIVEE